VKSLEAAKNRPVQLTDGQEATDDENIGENDLVVDLMFNQEDTSVSN